jgi:DNA-binding transcriptional MerR regulator
LADDRDAVLSIGELSRRTGVSIAALRAWETRHRILRPARTPGGQRAYREDDVSRVQAVLDLTQRGWTLRAVARRLDEAGDGSTSPDDPRADEHPAAEEQLPAPAPADHLSIDVEALLICHRALRRLLRIVTAREAVEVVVALVEEVGGEVGPLRPDEDSPLDVDLSLGEGEPIFPRAEPLTLARMRLEAILPWLVDDAGHLAARARAAPLPHDPERLRPAS